MHLNVPQNEAAEGSGVTIKLEGETRIEEGTGRLKTVFKEDPQQPFSELELSLKGGEDAPLVNPTACGNAVAPADVTAWSAIYKEGVLTDPNALVKLTAPGIPISGCGPQLFVRAKHAHGAKATIVLHVPYAGKLVANGKGISKVSKRIRKHGGRMAITVKLKRHLREQLRHSRRHHVNVTVHLRFSSHHHKALKGQLKVRLK